MAKPRRLVLRLSLAEGDGFAGGLSHVVLVRRVAGDVAQEVEVDAVQLARAFRGGAKHELERLFAVFLFDCTEERDLADAGKAGLPSQQLVQG